MKRETGRSSSDVEWRPIAPDEIEPPIVERLPYLELKLEHPDLEPTTFGDQFYPDAIPYRIDGSDRIFYWRSALSTSGADPAAWQVACGTTNELVGIVELPAPATTLTEATPSGTIVVVDGTVGGSASTTCIPSYAEPSIVIRSVSTVAVELHVDESRYRVTSGERRRVTLDPRRIDDRAVDGCAATVSPELVIRFPGERELHHPAAGRGYRLFPSFGLDLETVPNPLPVPTTVGELDQETLATDLDVNLTERPFPERVLWQAFAYSAFDPRDELVPALTQLDTGHVALTKESPE